MAEKTKKKRNGKLAISLTLTIALPAILLNFVQATVSIETMQKQVTEQNIERYEGLAENFSDIISLSVKEIEGRLDFYAKTDIVRSGNTPEIVDWLLSTADNRYRKLDYVAWVNSEGEFYGDNGSMTNVKERDYFLAIMKDGKDTFIDNPVTSKTTGKTVVHLCKAVKNTENKNIGFICGVINVTEMDSVLEDIQIGNKGVAIMLGGNGQEISMKGDSGFMNSASEKGSLTTEESQQQNEEALKGILAGKTGHFWNTVDKSIGSCLSVYTPIEGTPWGLVMIIYKTHISGLADHIGMLMTIFSVILGVLIVVVCLISIIITIKPIKVLENSISEIATGNADLTKRIDIKNNNEIGRVVESFNTFTEKLQVIVSAIKSTKDELVVAGQALTESTSDTSSSITEIISNIESMGSNINNQSNSVHETAGAVNEIASNIESLNNMIEGQASAVTQASTAVEEMIGNINSVNNMILKMSDEFKDLENKASIGLQKQDDVSNKIEVISDESQALQEANSVISNIAEQTNLLAMNAAIEAAHAGEAGKGFSVVADEIRKLSETSSQQSDTIGNQLKKIIDSISDIVQASADARQSFSEVSKGIISTTNLVEEISNSMAEQSEGSKQISIALNNMNDTTSQVRTSSFEMSEGNKAILEEVKTLQDATFSMKNGMNEMSIGANQVNQAGAQLSEIAQNMEGAISQIGDQVDEFKV